MQVFDQAVVHEQSDCTVTLLEHASLEEPMFIRGDLALEPGSPIVWFTFPGASHDIGRFHDADGNFTGFYANVLTPVEFESPTSWRTTDLFLDVWLTPGGAPVILDADELAAAEATGELPCLLAQSARGEAARIIDRCQRDQWPPPIAREWTLARALAALA